MKSFYGLLVGLFISVSALANGPEIKWGSALNSNSFVNTILGQDETGVYALSWIKKDLYIERYDNEKYELDYSTELVIPEIKGKEQKFENIYFLEKSIILFSSFHDKKADMYYTYAYTVDKATGKVKSNRTSLFEIPVEKRKLRGYFDFVVNPDANRIMCFHSVYNKKESTKTLTMRMFDNDLNQLGEIKEEFKIELEGRRDAINWGNYTIDDAGNVFLLQSKAIVKSGKVIDQENKILKYEADRDFARKDFDISLQEKGLISSLSFTIDNENNINVSGFYSERTEKGLIKFQGLEGTFFLKLSPENEVLSNNLERFDDEFKAQFLSERQMNKDRAMGIPIMRSLVQRDDGGLVLVADYYTYVYSESDQVVNQVWTWLDILVISINPDGTIRFAKKVGRRQRITKTSPKIGFLGGGFFTTVTIPLKKDKTVFCGHLFGVDEDKIHFVFNDNPKNLAIEDSRDFKWMSKPEKAVPVVVTIDVDGNINKEMLDGAASSATIIRPRISYQSDNNRVIVYGSRKKVDRFGEITF